MNTPKLELLYEAARTRRFHTHQGVEQNLADHSFGVALIIMVMHPNPSANLLKHALAHDLHESAFGDIPYSAKIAAPVLREIESAFEEKFWSEIGMQLPKLTDEEQLWLKFADRLEAYFFLLNQPALSEKLVRIAQEALEISNQIAEQLKAYGYFKEPQETVH